MAVYSSKCNHGSPCSTFESCSAVTSTTYTDVFCLLFGCVVNANSDAC